MAADALRVQVLFAAIDKLTGPLKGMGAGSKGLKAELASTRKELQALQRAQGSSANFRKAEADYQSLGDKVKAARLAHAAYRQELANVEKVTAAQARKLEQLAAAEGKAGAAYQAQGVKLQRLGRELEAAGVDVAELGAHESRLANRVYDTTRRLDQQTSALERNEKAQARVAKAQELGGKMRDVGTTAVAAGAAIGAPLALAGKSAADFESLLTDIGQKADLSRGQVAAMGREFDRMGPKVGQVPLKLAEGVDILMGFGLGQKQALEAIRPIGTAATAYKAEIVDLAAATFASLDNLKVPAQQTAKTLDIMAKAGKSGAFEIKDMAQYFPALTASANALGQNGVGAVADLAAALQITRKGAGDSATAANNLQNLLNKINTEDTIKNFKEFGIELPAAMKKAAAEGKSPIEAIAELTSKATGGDLSKLSFLFGDAQVQAALRPLVQNMGLYRQIRADALKAQGDVEADFANRLGDANAKWERMKAVAQSVAHVVGGALLPALGGIMDKVSSVGERVGVWAQANPALVATLAKIAAIVAVVLVGVGGLAIALGAVVGPFAMLAFSAGKAASLLGAALPVFGALRTAALFMARGVVQAGAMMLANPVVLAVVAIVAALGVAAYLIWKHWDRIKGAFATAGAWIMAKLGQLKALFLRFPFLFGPIGVAAAFVVNHWSAIKGAFVAGGGWIAGKLGQLKALFLRFPFLFGPIGAAAGFVANHWSTIKGAFATAAAWIAGKLGGVRGLLAMVPALFGPLGAVVAFVSSHWQQIVGAFTAAGAWLSGKLAQLGALLARVPSLFAPLSGAAAIAARIWAAIKAAFAAGVAYLVALPGRMASIGANIIQGLINGVTGKLAALKTTITGAASSAAGWFKAKLGIRSPSRVFMTFGGHITEGLARGIAGGEAAAVRGVDRLSRRVAAAFTPPPPVAVPTLAAAPAIASSRDLVDRVRNPFARNLVDDTGAELGRLEALRVRFIAAGRDLVDGLGGALGRLATLRPRLPGLELGELGTWRSRIIAGGRDLVDGADRALGRLATLRPRLPGLELGELGELGKLRGKFTAAGDGLVDGLGRVLGRVGALRPRFLAIGEQMSASLSRGMAAGEGAAVRGADRLSRRVAGALAASSLVATPAAAIAEAIAARPAIPVAPTAPIAARAAAPASSSSSTRSTEAAAPGLTIGSVTIQITQAPGEDAAALARRLMGELEQLKSSQSRSSYNDD